MKFISAYTPAQLAPPYVNISGDADTVRITVRGKPGPAVYGPEAAIDIPRAAWAKMVREIQAELTTAV